MSPGAVVEIVSGPWVGRVGIVECITVEGVAVRCRPMAGLPREVVVASPRDLRLVDSRVCAA